MKEYRNKETNKIVTAKSSSYITTTEVFFVFDEDGDQLATVNAWAFNKEYEEINNDK